jgi:hypothetical protein
MARKKLDFGAIAKMAADLSGVEQSTSYGSPSLKVRGKLMACIAVHRSAEPDSLVVCVDLESREAMIEEAPDVYYLTDHYVNYPCVLVRLNRIQPAALRGLLRMAWRLATAESRARKRAQPNKKA